MTGEAPAAAAPREAAPAAEPAEACAASTGRARGLKRRFTALALGSVGVVFGDIGTSPLYAMREALGHARPGEGPMAVYGVVSLVLWTLTLMVSVKYLYVLMRSDNHGEGGVLALSALAQQALGRRSKRVFVIGLIGAALFYGDSLITPAISVMGAVEGLNHAPDAGHTLHPYVLPVSAGILVVLFMAQARGTQRMAIFFGPVTTLWFLAIAILGLSHLKDDWSILRAFSPYYAVRFLIENGFVGFVILGSIFLAVTGAEALYADMGHFGKGPIRVAWAFLVFPALALNYLGQGALVLHHPWARHDPFFALIPSSPLLYWPVLALATSAAVIASQAVITGAFSMTQQAVQLGLLPRMEIRRTSETQAGQIFAPSVNLFLMIGVLMLLAIFQNSHRLASAYGIAVTGTMFITTLLAYVIVHRLWKWPVWATGLLLVPLTLLDLVFIGSNLLKIPQGGWLPLMMGGGLMLVMWTWTRGAQILTDKTRKDSLPLADLIEMLQARPPYRGPGTAIFPTSDPDMAPVPLMHNLKHNKVLHQHNILLTVLTAETPRVEEADRIRIERINDDFKKVTITYGFMETPNLPKALQQCRKQGLKFDIMSTSFFLGRRTLVPAQQPGMPLWQDKLFIFLMKNAANPTDFFKIPPGRVVELGAQLTV
ncbi:MAG: potassium transporter Kup [Caulobacteraceae bacterium]|nr:potassium transporter Kup [Caulobacteraceae bacterium]